jgi:hypothetical protein
MEKRVRILVEKLIVLYGVQHFLDLGYNVEFVWIDNEFMPVSVDLYLANELLAKTKSFNYIAFTHPTLRSGSVGFYYGTSPWKLIPDYEAVLGNPVLGTDFKWTEDYLFRFGTHYGDEPGTGKAYNAWLHP